MGKGRDKRKKAQSRSGASEGKVSGAAKTAQKTEKREDKEKRRREVGGEDDIDAALRAIELESKKETEAEVVEVEGPPQGAAARSGFGMTLTDATAKVQGMSGLAPESLLLFGGERLDERTGKVRMYNDLFAYETKKKKWRRFAVPKAPSPRSGHSCFFHRNCLYVFGGEYTSPNQEKFRHFRELWRLDFSAMMWDNVTVKRGGPGPRSGHRITRVGASTFALFGGYFDDGVGAVKYFNDLWLLHVDELKWEPAGNRDKLWPSARSGFQMAAYLPPSPAERRLYLHGGYVKVRDEDAGKDAGAESERGRTLTDSWCLNLVTMEWNKLKRKGLGPGGRAGSTMAVHPGTSRALLFGGASDSEAKKGEVLISEFYNELYYFDMEKERWGPMLVGERGSPAPPQKERALPPHEVESEPSSSSSSRGGILAKAATRIQAHYRGYRIRKAYRIYKLGGALSEMLYSTPAEGVVGPRKSGPKPLGRINAGMAVAGGSTLFIYGGIIEMGDTEITLDDMWSLDLKKKNRWECLHPPSVTEKELRDAGAASEEDEDSEGEEGSGED